MNKRQAELLLQGRVQKGAFSLLFNYKEMRSTDIANRLGEGLSSVTNALKALIKLEIAEKIKLNGQEIRGAYKCLVTRK